MLLKEREKKMMWRRSRWKKWEDVDDEIRNCGKIVVKGMRVRGVKCVGGMVFEVLVWGLLVVWGEMGKGGCVEEVEESCMYELIGRVGRDIGRDKVSVDREGFG